MTKSKHLHIRASEKDITSWRRAAKIKKIDLTKWVTLNNNLEAAMVIVDARTKSKTANP